MLWLIIIIAAYFLFALASLADRYLLIGPPNPRIYAFYVGILNILVLIFIPFVDFYSPGNLFIGLSFLYGLIFILSLLAIYEGLEKFEASRFIPALGAFLPIFTFLLTLFILSQKEFFTYQKILSFSFLVLGGFLISWEKSFKISLKSLLFAVLAAFFLSLSFVLLKIIYNDLGFWNGFVWTRLGVFFCALFLLFFKKVRTELFQKKKSFTKKTTLIFISTQIIGALGVIFQNWSIFLAGVVYLPFISALQSIQYLFLFVFSLLFYKVLKERIFKKIIFQKIFAIILITLGLVFLALE